ncbi:bifunctional 2-polyprenyl-6-hydroxyphenol methylase/3-demethylubiquinol 3-O-methyltransferase UbiG [Homoserinibacter sp. GY 40078]|uniref:class I SAM-dependent methyltransferase n=1 Tax=Homoserinibacter sp. GY 40078 TaxID=2603275 RepID=UPI0011CA21D0|nr:methyltransferase domain-containing protein [Homoserinibacter sp. GY 40078]TXK17656.1 SAM-dependent methyltransferase [Homoserinibacter sp. GY 40078]
MVHARSEPRAMSGFGSGLREPYGRALRDPTRTLYLRDAQTETRTDSVRVEVERFLAAADAGDEAIVADASGPVLDVGCGPGRMVHAAIMAGHLALGVDISETAVRIGQDHGLPVLQRSVFHDLPGEGEWGTVLLIDGNIGIGGDPVTLLARCGELMHPEGRVIVEAHPEPERDRVFMGIVVDDLDHESLPFPWAEVGAERLRVHARRAGLTVVREWSTRGRAFTELSRG